MNPVLGGIICVIVFSFGNVFIVWGREFPPFQFSAMSFFLGSISIMSFQALRGKLEIKSWKKPPRFYATVFLGMGAYSILLTQAFAYGSAFSVNILNYAWPLFWVILSAIVTREMPKALQILGLFSSFAGMILVFAATAEPSASVKALDLGNFLAVIAAFMWALYSVFSKPLDYKPDFMAPVIFLAGCVALAFHLALEETVLEVTPLAWAGVIILGFSRAVYVLWDYAIKKGDAVTLSSLAYFTPLLSCIWFVIAGYMPQNLAIALAAALIVGGCIITNAGALKKAHDKIKARRNATLG